MQGGTAHADPGIADDAVQTAIAGYRGIHQCFDLLRTAAICADKDGIATLFADLICHGLSLLLTAGGADHIHSVFSKHCGNRPANSAACAGNDCDLPLYAAEIHC